MLDGNEQKVVIGDKIEYLGTYDDDNDLYDEMQENGFVHEVINFDKDGRLFWVVGCSYAIQADLTQLWIYD